MKQVTFPPEKVVRPPSY